MHALTPKTSAADYYQDVAALKSSPDTKYVFCDEEELADRINDGYFPEIGRPFETYCGLTTNARGDRIYVRAYSLGPDIVVLCPGSWFWNIEETVLRPPIIGSDIRKSDLTGKNIDGLAAVSTTLLHEFLHMVSKRPEATSRMNAVEGK